MGRVGAAEAGVAFVVALIGTAVLVLLGRLIGRGLRAVTVRLLRVVDEVVATVLIVVLLVAAGSWVIGGAAWRGATAVANSIFSVSNGDTTEGVQRPTSVAVSGSAASLVSWESLGRTGRDFAGGVTTSAELAAFAGPGAEVTEPVRAYVGVESADTVQERAELAVRELERAGGFERSVLVVWTPTGSGWMIAEAATALEQMYGGDTAIVGIQYSFLPSILAVFMYDGYAEKAGAALFTAVEERWRQLPPDSRPILLVFGKSLGTTGAETPFAAYDAASSVGNMLARTDGALIVGARKSNVILSQLTGERDAGSPVWQPVFQEGRAVRFVGRDPSQPTLTPDRSLPQVVYLQHPSDPVPFWGLDVLWGAPAWMEHPRGYDVPQKTHWFPVVTAVQALSDQYYQLSTPPGFGHDYATEYVEGWSQVAPPPGWSEADATRLEEYLDYGSTEGEQER